MRCRGPPYRPPLCIEATWGIDLHTKSCCSFPVRYCFLTPLFQSYILSPAPYACVYQDDFISYANCWKMCTHGQVSRVTKVCDWRASQTVPRRERHKSAEGFLYNMFLIMSFIIAEVVPLASLCVCLYMRWKRSNTMAELTGNQVCSGSDAQSVLPSSMSMLLYFLARFRQVLVVCADCHNHMPGVAWEQLLFFRIFCIGMYL